MPALDGKVVIVTGASRGIGKGLALGVAREGARVVCAARTVSEEPGGLPGTIGATVDAIRAAGGDATAVRCDIGVEADLHALVATTVDTCGGVDVLVNNAMAPTRALFEDATAEEWDESMRVNVRSLFVLAKAVVPAMAARGGGSIINISSGGAEHASQPHLPAGFLTYAVAKAAMERFSSALAPEIAPLGVAVNALRPGAVKTELATRELGEDFDWSGWATPEAVVPAVVFLAQQTAAGGFTGRIVDSTQYGTVWP